MNREKQLAADAKKAAEADSLVQAEIEKNAAKIAKCLNLPEEEQEEEAEFVPKTYKDLISNDDMVANTLVHCLKNNNAILEVRPTYYDNMLKLYDLELVTLTKPEFMAYVKAFLPKVK